MDNIFKIQLDRSIERPFYFGIIQLNTFMVCTYISYDNNKQPMKQIYECSAGYKPSISGETAQEKEKRKV